MEASLLVRCECKDPQQRDIILTFLTKGKRPYFEDEVEEKFHPIFDALEFAAFPRIRKKLGQTALRASWDLGGASIEGDTRDILMELNEAGVVDIFAYLSADDADLFLSVKKDGEIKSLTNWDEDELNDIRGEPNKEFRYLDQVRATFLQENGH